MKFLILNGSLARLHRSSSCIHSTSHTRLAATWPVRPAQMQPHWRRPERYATRNERVVHAGMASPAWMQAA